jgi:hypothetical protein
MNCACEFDHEAKRFKSLCALHHLHAERDRAPQLLELERQNANYLKAIERIEAAISGARAINS